MPKMNANVFITKDYKNETALRPKKTNPNKPNSNPVLSAVERANLETTPGQKMVKISFCIYGNRGAF